jgi:hypothetical protein
VTGCGRICFRGRKVNLSHVFAGQSVGVTVTMGPEWTNDVAARSASPEQSEGKR